MQNLRLYVFALLRQVSALMHRASTVLGTDSAGKKYAEFEREVTQAARQIEDLQLKMVIVAPMKAGKSTIINALIGQELLPSRNTSMTILPTEIIFDKELTEPVLTLSWEIREAFQAAFFTLQQRIRALGVASAQERMPQYPHLLQMVRRIQAKTAGSIPEKVLGEQRILNHIGALNDIIRLCGVLDPLANPLHSLTELPRLYTPFWHSSGVSEDEFRTAEQSEPLGNLVIVDTPGPNEADVNLRLEEIVSQQLQKSLFVLLVLDFTQLRTRAAESVKQQVQRVLELRGKDKLYVLVNKVDQRRKGDLTPEQVQQLVTAELGMDQSEHPNRVFEVSAIRAFAATNFLRELQQHPNATISQLETASTLAQEVLGLKWQEKLERMSVEELQVEAQYLWEKSGFAPFVETVSNTLIAEVGPLYIMSALKITQSRLVELRGTMQLRSNAIQQEQNQLRLALEMLRDDLHRLEEKRQHLKVENQIQEAFQHQLTIILNQIHESCQISLEPLLNENPRNVDSEKKMITEKNQLVDLIHLRLEKPSNVLRLRSLKEVEDFTHLLVSSLQTMTETVIESNIPRINKQIEQAVSQLNEQLEKQSFSIIEQSMNYLNVNFKVNLPLFPKNQKLGDTESEASLIIDLKKLLEQGDEEKEVAKHDWKYSLLQAPLQNISLVNNFYDSGNFYTISLQEIVNQVNQLMEQILEKMQQEISQFLNQRVRERIDILSNILIFSLRNYSESLQQALDAQSLSLEEKISLLRNLDSLVAEANENIVKIDVYRQYSDYLLFKTSRKNVDEGLTLEND